MRLSAETVIVPEFRIVPPLRERFAPIPPVTFKKLVPSMESVLVLSIGTVCHVQSVIIPQLLAVTEEFVREWLN